jgi:hypothetical protein
VNVLEHLTEIAHIEPFSADRAFHKVIGFTSSEAVGIPASHGFAFGFNPSSSHCSR